MGPWGLVSAVLCCSAWLAASSPGNCASSHLSLSGWNHISGTWEARVNDVQITFTHLTNASDKVPWSYGDWEHNMTFASSNCHPQKNDGSSSFQNLDFDVVIVDVNSRQNDTDISRPGAILQTTSERYPGYSRFPGLGLYKLHEDHLSWQEAVDACDAEQAYLAVLNSQREADAVSTLFQARPGQGVASAYLGLRDVHSEGRFISVLGERMEELGYSQWDDGQPGATPGERCVLVSQSGLLSDGACYRARPYVCEAWLLD